MPRKRKWTNRDDRNAAAEGWSLFDCGAGEIRIQKIDDPDNYPTPCPVELKSDIAAIRLVYRKARQGSQLHMKALSLLKPRNLFLDFRK